MVRPVHRGARVPRRLRPPPAPHLLHRRRCAVTSPACSTRCGAAASTTTASSRRWRSVPRELFVLPEQRGDAYADRALAIDCGQTISQPLMVAVMVQALEVGQATACSTSAPAPATRRPCSPPAAPASSASSAFPSWPRPRSGASPPPASTCRSTSATAATASPRRRRSTPSPWPRPRRGCRRRCRGSSAEGGRLVIPLHREGDAMDDLVRLRVVDGPLGDRQPRALPVRPPDRGRRLPAPEPAPAGTRNMRTSGPAADPLHRVARRRPEGGVEDDATPRCPPAPGRAAGGSRSPRTGRRRRRGWGSASGSPPRAGPSSATSTWCRPGSLIPGGLSKSSSARSRRLCSCCRRRPAAGGSFTAAGYRRRAAPHV